MLTLVIDKDDQRIADSNIRIRWCISRDIIKALALEKIENPRILLIVSTPGNNGEIRYLLPLDDLVAWVGLLGPGENTISAAIVWGDHAKRYMKPDVYSGGRTIYSKQVIYNGELEGVFPLSFSSLLGDTSVTAQLKVQAPEGVFASQPSEREWAWVNRWFETAPRDQCSYRRRKILAFTAQPVLLAVFYTVWYPMKFVAALFSLFAVIIILGFYKGANPNILLPWRWGQHKQSILRDEDKRRSYWEDLYTFFFTPSPEAIARRKAEAEQRVREYYEQNIESTSCEHISVPVGRLLPAQKKVSLLFKNIKAGVCRPFAS